MTYQYTLKIVADDAQEYATLSAEIDTWIASRDATKEEDEPSLTITITYDEIEK